MNKLLISLLLFVVTSIASYAQHVEITPFYGYQVGSTTSTILGELKMYDSSQYGGIASITIRRKLYGEVSYTLQDAVLRAEGNLPPYPRTREGLKAHHVQLGAIQAFGNDDDIEPFLGASVGWSFYEAENQGSLDTFSFAVSGGVKYFFTNSIGIRLQTQLLVPVQWGGVYYGYDGAHVSSGSAILNWNFAGGLIFAFGDGGKNVTFN